MPTVILTVILTVIPTVILIVILLVILRGSIAAHNISCYIDCDNCFYENSYTNCYTIQKSNLYLQGIGASSCIE